MLKLFKKWILVYALTASVSLSGTAKPPCPSTGNGISVNFLRRHELTKIVRGKKVLLDEETIFQNLARYDAIWCSQVIVWRSRSGWNFLRKNADFVGSNYSKVTRSTFFEEIKILKCLQAYIPHTGTRFHLAYVCCTRAWFLYSITKPISHILVPGFTWHMYVVPGLGFHVWQSHNKTRFYYVVTQTWDFFQNTLHLIFHF